MIKNERQYTVTRKQAERLEASLAALHAQPASTDPDDVLFRQIQANALRGQLADLQLETQAYEELKTGNARPRELASIEEIPHALIAARIAAGLTQRELAERVGIREQMIQRYEANDYAAASFDRLRSVAVALNVDFRGVVVPARRADQSAAPER